MAALTANPQSALGPPSWDETIVPTLRKRLESESRILSKRLSTISISDDTSHPDPVQNGRRAVSPASNSTGESHIPISSYSQRPSAIPRPSYTRGGSNGSTSTPARNGDSVKKGKRQRTLSTPFPFEAIAKSAEPPLPNGNAALAASTSTAASRVQSPPLGRTTPTPSRIPTVTSRARSASQSSQRVLNGGKSSLPASYKTANEDASQSTETLPQSLKNKASAISLSKQRIVDEQRPFPSESSAKTIDEGHLSSDEEQPFQHWYRGDVARSGGVGEYKVGKRMEMLDIANYGHALGTSRKKHAYEEPILRSQDVVQPRHRKRAESFSSIERTSIYMDPQDADGRVLDETPLTDLDAEETDHEHARYPSDPYARFNAAGYEPPLPQEQQQSHSKSDSQDTSQLPPSRIPTPTAQHPQSRIPQSGRSRQTSISQPRSRSTSISQQKALSSSTSAVPGPSNGTGTQNTSTTQRGRTKPSAGTPSKTPVKRKSQKRSKSAGDALRSTGTKTPEPLGINTKDYDGLADAVPDTRTPIPKNGNWDDVILPTVARRMGIEYEMEDPETARKKREREAPVEPAPGTFGFDHTKYKPPRPSEGIPMNEFGQLPAQLSSQPQPESQNEDTTPLPEPKFHRPRRDTLPTTPPFSDYIAPPPEMPRVPNMRERTDAPQMIIPPPQETMQVSVEEEKGGGCCKCVVM